MSRKGSPGERRESDRSNGAPRWSWLAVALVAAAVYANSIHNDFVFDDRLLIEKNSAVQGQGGWGDLLLTPYHWGYAQTQTGLYRPLTLATLAADFSLYGLRPTGYHVLNLLLHALVSTAVLFLGRRLGLTPLAAWAGALIFAVHPVHTEAVANLAGRAELLSGLGVLAALLMYLRTSKRGHAVAAGLALLLALCAKENAVTLLGVVMVWELLARFREPAGRLRAWRSTLGRILPLVVALAAYLVLRGYALGGALAGPGEISAVDNPLVEADPVTRWATAVVVAARYLGLLLWPRTLSPDYSFAQIVPVESLFAPAVLGAAVLWLVVAALLFRAVSRAPTAAFLGLFSLITFSIASNVVVVIGTIMAERLLYLPSVGVCLLAGMGLQALAGRLGPRAVLALLGVMLVLGGARTVTRNRDWRDGLTLFSAAVHTSPRSVKVRSNLAAELMKIERHTAAREHLRVALEIAPGYVTARRNLVQCLIELGEPAEAEREARALLAEEPADGRVRFQLGHALRAQGRSNEAEAAFLEALKVEPASAEIRAALAMIELERGDNAAAEARLREAIRADPDAVTARNALGLLLQRTARLPEAIEQFRQAVRFRPDAMPLVNNLANALRDAGRLDESQRELERALQTRPDFAPSHYNLGLTLERAGQSAAARRRFERALALQPGYPGAHRALGRLALDAGEPQRALETLGQAIGLDPSDVEARALRARAHLALGRLDEAEADYRELLRLNPRSVAAHNNLGIIHATRGDKQAARRAWRAALRLAPGSEEILRNLERLEQ